MPLHTIINPNTTTQIYLWKITETFEDLFDSVSLKDVSLVRLNNMKSLSHQKGFMAVRMLLQHIGYSDHDLHYDNYGKPSLNSHNNEQELLHISISHSHEFSAIAISNSNIGLDIELKREKIIKLAERFTNEAFIFAAKQTPIDFINKLTVSWGIKESIFKIKNEVGISYKDHVFAHPFEMNDKHCIAQLDHNTTSEYFDITFDEIENYIVVCAIPK